MSAVILVALVRFGPINEIAPQILGHLQTLDLGAMEEWARTVCPPFQYELYHSSKRLSDQALGEIKGFRKTLKFLGGEGRTFPLNLIQAADGLNKLIEDVELERFGLVPWGKTNS